MLALRPAIHLFAEDMDLCLRARANGLRTHYHPDLEVTHTGRHSVASEPFEPLARQRRDVDRAHARDARARRLDDAAQLLTFATRAVVKAPTTTESAPRPLSDEAREESAGALEVRLY